MSLPSNNPMSDEKDKSWVEHDEFSQPLDTPRDDYDIAVPDSLRGVSEDDISIMDKRITTRIDFIIMPVSESRNLEVNSD
jgi:hypothetical protein